MNEYWKFYFNPILWWPFRLQQNICCFPVSHAHDAFYKCSDFSELQVHECLWVCTFHHTCLCVRGEVVLSDKGAHLEPPGFIWAKQERGPCLSGPLFCPQWGLRATNRRCLLSTHTWAPPSLGPTSLSLAPSLYCSLHPCNLFPLFLSLPSVSSPLLSQAMAWPTFTSHTPDPLMSTVLALSTDHVYIWKWPLCSILSLFMNIHFTNRICS